MCVMSVSVCGVCRGLWVSVSVVSVFVGVL